ncbi:MAG: hypothetical protein GF341_06230, partial [candidate division Zixibacteria bacterium]|nr:hypothetical protein [candidate division Zixibacteria bacterium]
MNGLRLIRTLLAIIWLACGIYGAVQLATSDIETIRFWDEADLMWDIGVPDFASEGGRLGAISYATRKIGYAYPVTLLSDWQGNTGVVYWNLLWFVIILLLPIPGVREWTAYAFKAGALLSLPYVVKYVTMVNPTIQAMGLWLILVTLYVYWRRLPDPSRFVHRALAAIIGIVGGLIVITDFKWLPFVAVSVVLLLMIDPPQPTGELAGADGRLRPLLRRVVPRAVLILVGLPVVMAITALLFRPYGGMVYSMLFALPGHVGVVRPGMSENVLIHLWYLGGLGIVLGTLVGVIMLVKRDLSAWRRYAPYWLPPAVICLAFSLIVWPRGARMFAPALIPIIVLGAIVISRHDLWHTKSMRQPLLWVVLVLLTLPMLTNVGRIRDVIETPTGLDELKAHITAHTVGPLGGTPDEEPLYQPRIMGGYMLPLMVMRASRDPDMMWYSPATGLRETSNWVFLNPVTDALTIEEQAAGGVVAFEWKQNQYYMRESMERSGQTVASIPAPFYTTPFY